MTLLFCRKSCVNLVYAVLLIGCISCGNAFRIHKHLQSDIPPSNTHVGEKAIASALLNSGIPECNGIEVVCVVDGEGKANNLLKISAPEFLLTHGYSVFTDKQSTPVIRFSLDTLYVNLDIKREKNEEKKIQRYSEARVSAVYYKTSAIKEVYIGHGVHEDSFPFKMLDTAGNNESFVHFNPATERISEKIKPFLLGVSMSALIWLLYSYRG